jgi:hypothetical protein
LFIAEKFVATRKKIRSRVVFKLREKGMHAQTGTQKYMKTAIKAQVESLVSPTLELGDKVILSWTRAQGGLTDASTTGMHTPIHPHTFPHLPTHISQLHTHISDI